jgi:hypothetical protein
LEARHIRSGASRDRHGDVVWLDFVAPHRHIVVDVTVTSARTNTNVPHIGARLPLPGSLALGAQHGKLDADMLYTFPLCLARLRFSRSMTTIPSLWRIGAGWRLWRLSCLIAWLLCSWHFVTSLAWVMLTLGLCVETVMSAVCNIWFVELLPLLSGACSTCSMPSCSSGLGFVLLSYLCFVVSITFLV